MPNNMNNDSDSISSDSNAEVSAAQPRPVRAPTRVQRERRISWIWLLPILAIIVGLSVLVRMWMGIGPTIVVTFNSAEGLKAGQTQLRYRDVVVGTVSELAVASDREQVEVHIKLNKEGSDFITQPTSRFWVVRPRLGISGVSGLGTLLSGAYISVDAPTTLKEDSDTVTRFVGLEDPPEITASRPGTRFSLLTNDLASIERGSPIYYRGLTVGQVIGYNLDEHGDAVSLQVFVDAPYDRYVTTDSRFWNVSGIDLELDANGFSLQAASIVSALIGGIEFASGPDESAKKAPSNHRFKLFKNKDHAMARPDGEPFLVAFHFYQSVRGLRTGATIDFQGLELGKVTEIFLDYDVKEQRFYSVVHAEIYPLRLGRAYELLLKRLDETQEPVREFFGGLIAHGFRAQLRQGNILTGQQYVALDFIRNAEPVEFQIESTPLLIPVIKGEFARLQEQVTNVMTKIEQLPLKELSGSLEANFKSLNGLIKRLDEQVVPSSRAALEAAQKALERVEAVLADDSPLSRNIEQSLGELQRTLRSLTDVTSELQTQPSSLLRGRAKDKLPESR